MDAITQGNKQNTHSNGLIRVQRIGIQALIHDTAFTFPTMDDLNSTYEKNGKSTIPEDSEEQHYYYGYSISRKLIYLEPRIFIPGLSGFFYCLGYGSTSSSGNGWVRGTKGSTSDTFEGGGAGGTATPVLLLSGGWTGIPSKIERSYPLAASILRLALVTR